MTRVPLPESVTMELCDPCAEMRAKYKLTRRLLARMVSEAGGAKYITLGDESDDDDLDIVRADKSGSWKLTTVE